MGLVPGATAKAPGTTGCWATLLYLATTVLWCVAMLRHLEGQAKQMPWTISSARTCHFLRPVLHWKDSARPISDQLPAAVNTLANYEIFYGNWEIYSTHKKGLVTLITLRGGLQRLGCDGFMASMLLWHDARAASIAGCHPHLDTFRQILPKDATNS